MNRLASQTIVELLNAEMSLGNDRVWIRDQSRDIPADERLFITVGMVSSKVISSTTKLKTDIVDGSPVCSEVNSVTIREDIQINVFSRNQDAIRRRWEVVAALNSIRAKQLQEAHAFKILWVPTSFVNASAAEGGSQLNRYSLSFPCFVCYKKERVLAEDASQFYDEFTTRFDDEATIGEDEGVFEFTINENTEI